MDIDLSEFKKGEANLTGFQLVNYVDPGVSRVVQQWMDFDKKDSKVPKKGLKVNTLRFTFSLTMMENLPGVKSESPLETPFTKGLSQNSNGMLFSDTVFILFI